MLHLRCGLAAKHRKARPRWKNVSIELPGYSIADWDRHELHIAIRERVRKLHPEWMLHGYCPKRHHHPDFFPPLLSEHGAHHA
jgi:hypothetical protein